MENLVLSLNVVLPLFINISLGYLLVRVNLLDDYSVKKLNNVVFKVFLPTLLFMNIYNTDVSGVFDAPLLIFSLVCVMIIFGLGLIFIPIIEKDNKRRGVLMQCLFRSNFVFFGVPICQSLSSGEGIGAIALLVAVVVPVFNVLAVVSLQLYMTGEVKLKSALVGIAKNPLIIGSVLGVLALLLRIKLPTVVVTVGNDLSKMATPLALILLGGTFKFHTLHRGIKSLVNGMLLKLVIVPILFIPISIVFGFRGIELVGLMVLFAAPIAVSSFTMSVQMGADGDLASQMVVFTSLVSIVTVFLWIFLLKQFGLI